MIDKQELRPHTAASFMAPESLKVEKKQRKGKKTEQKRDGRSCKSSAAHAAAQTETEDESFVLLPFELQPPA